MPLAVGGVLICLFVTEHILNRLTGRVVETEADAEAILMTEA